MNLPSLQACLESAWSSHKAGQLDDAETAYRRALQLAPEHPLALQRLGLVAHARGRLAEAEALIGRALAAAPDNPVFLYTLGIVLDDGGQPSRAVDAYRRAVAVQPDLAPAHFNLGLALAASDQLAAAAEALATAAALRPSHVASHAQRGAVLLRLGRAAAAAESFRAALELEPGRASRHYDLGRALAATAADAAANTGDGEAALVALARALELDPKHAAALAARVDLLLRMNRAEEATAVHGEALAAQPDNLPAAVAARLGLPMVYATAADIAVSRGRYARQLAHLEADLPGLLTAPPGRLWAAAERVNFHLAYQGEDDRDLQAQYGRIIGEIVGKLAPRMLESPPARPRHRRLRIGFASFFFWRTTVGCYFGPWVAGLDKRRFETRVYHFGPIEDQVTRAIRAAADGYRHLPGSVLEAAERIRADELDVLVFPELGMNGKLFLLAAMRLAPVQCAAWGHPVTSGLANVDYFLSCADMEPADAAVHYSETLLGLPGIGTRYLPPALPERGSRASLGLPEGKRLYLFPQSLFKIHPDNDRLLAELLAGDADAVLFLFRSANPFVQAAFRARLDAALAARGVAPERALMLPFLTHDDYLRVNLHADVMLDCLHWSGGNTSLDALATGLPVVTLPGRLMRGRQSQAMLRMLGVPELIVADRDAAIATALRVAADGDWQRELRRRIGEARGALFDRPEPLAALGETLAGLAERGGMR